MQHFGFILASYLSSTLILGVLALWLFLDHRNQKRALQELEARGIRRRSNAPADVDAKSANPDQVTK